MPVLFAKIVVVRLSSGPSFYSCLYTLLLASFFKNGHLIVPFLKNWPPLPSGQIGADRVLLFAKASDCATILASLQPARRCRQCCCCQRSQDATCEQPSEARMPTLTCQPRLRLDQSQVNSGRLLVEASWSRPFRVWPLTCSLRAAQQGKLCINLHGKLVHNLRPNCERHRMRAQVKHSPAGRTRA